MSFTSDPSNLFNLGFGASPGAPATPTPAGKFVDSGGGVGEDTVMSTEPSVSSSVGLPPPSEYSKRVGLFCEPKGTLLRVFCCGLIGGGTKMCIGTPMTCTVVGHKTKKFELDPSLLDEERILFIRCVPRKPRKDGTIPCPKVYVSPFVIASVFDGDLSDVLLRSDTVDHWCKWFNVLNSDTVKTAPRDVKIDLAKRAFKLEPTPAKRNRYTKLPFSPVHDDFEKITPMLESLPPSTDSSMAIDLIVKNWPLLIENINQLDLLMGSTRKNLAEFQESVEGDITTNELRAQSLLGTIGICSSSIFGTNSLWGALADLHKGLEVSADLSLQQSTTL
jgi:hypothetical protein